MSYYVYWLYTEDMTDITKQGYVGITYDTSVRFRQHRSFAVSRLRYPKEMQNAFISGEIKLKIVVQGAVDYCRDLERKLRPETYIGWNKAIGADGGVSLKHGLSGTKCKSSYYNLRDKASKLGKFFEWVCVEDFKDFYEEVYFSKGVFYLESSDGDYTKDNLLCMPRSEYLRVVQRRYELSGVAYSVSELSDLSGERPNTISTRLKRGWTVQEATYGR